MNIQSIIKKSLLACAVSLLSAAPGWAVPVSIEIQNGSSGGFGYSLVHAGTTHYGGGFYTNGAHLYDPLNGTLTGDLSTAGGLSLTNIMGTLIAPQGTLTFTGGTISDPGVGGYASGTLDYTLTGGAVGGTSGTFYFFAQAFGSGGPNNLYANEFYLWGNNWNKDVISRADFVAGGNTALGIDLKGTMQPVPEPGTLLLLGTGLAAMVGWRRRVHA